MPCVSALNGQGKTGRHRESLVKSCLFENSQCSAKHGGNGALVNLLDLKDPDRSWSMEEGIR